MQSFPPRFLIGLEVHMYKHNYFPNAKHTFTIRLEENGKFWQLVDDSGGLIAESSDWWEMKRWAEYKRLKVKLLK